MNEQTGAGFDEIEVGYEFPSVRYELSSSMVSTYLQAVGGTNALYGESALVPPMAIAAYALAALAENISLPPGLIHVSQELQFLGPVRVWDAITCRARVSRRQERGRLRILTVDIRVLNEAEQTVLAGKTSFTLPNLSQGTSE